MTESSSSKSSGSASSDRRAQTRGPDRRREAWHSFREKYPVFLGVIAVLLLGMVAADIWLAYRRSAYNAEISNLRAGMSDAERKKTDIVVQNEQDKLTLELELAKRQARMDSHLHLAVAVDSGLMYLERDGATLRVMRVALSAATVPGQAPPKAGDTTAAALPRGERTVQQVIDDPSPALVMNGDSRIYAGSDSGAVAAGSVRVAAADLKAILPNVSAGMPVYFY